MKQNGKGIKISNLCLYNLKARAPVTSKKKGVYVPATFMMLLHLQSVEGKGCYGSVLRAGTISSISVQPALKLCMQHAGFISENWNLVMYVASTAPSE